MKSINLIAGVFCISVSAVKISENNYDSSIWFILFLGILNLLVYHLNIDNNE